MDGPVGDPVAGTWRPRLANPWTIWLRCAGRTPGAMRITLIATRLPGHPRPASAGMRPVHEDHGLLSARCRTLPICRNTAAADGTTCVRPAGPVSPAAAPAAPGWPGTTGA